jgi:hypothetical protein
MVMGCPLQVMVTGLLLLRVRGLQHPVMATVMKQLVKVRVRGWLV